MNPPTVTIYCDKCMDYIPHYVSPLCNIGLCEQCLTPHKIDHRALNMPSIMRQEKRV